MKGCCGVVVADARRLVTSKAVAQDWKFCEASNASLLPGCKKYVCSERVCVI